MLSRPRVPRVQRSTLVLIVAVAALAFPLGALAVHQFDDVPTGASFHDDVEALVAHGITSGCQTDPPLYCPSSPVTRGQMAQFLNRLGSLDGTTPPSVDAATLQGSLPSVGSLLLVGSTNAQDPTTVESFTVDAPGPGTLLIEVMGNIWIDADASSASSLTTRVNWGICTTPNASDSCGDTYWDTHYQDADNVSSNNATPGSGRARTVEVSAAGPQTFYVNAETLASTTVFNLYSTWAVVTFVPGDSALSVTSPLPLGPAESETRQTD